MHQDDGLVRRFCSGDETAFDELVRSYAQRVYNLVYRFVHNREDAQELTQDVFLRVYSALPRFQGRSGLYTWIYRIAVNCALNHLRSRRRRVRTGQEVPLSDPALGQLSARRTPENDFRQAAIREAIATAVRQLPRQQQAVFVMRQYQGMDIKEIAAVLGISTGAVKSHYHFALVKLQRALQDWR